MKRLEDYVTSIPDFPQPGIIFRDITTVIQDPDGFQMAIDAMSKQLEGLDYDAIAVIDSRGFVFGAPIAYNLHKSLVLIRKKGKLPRATISEDYALEYGTASLEIHTDAIKPGDKVVLIDDLIATGGTLKASCKLIEGLGGQVAKVVTLIELPALKGREFLAGYDVSAEICFDGE